MTPKHAGLVVACFAVIACGGAEEVPESGKGAALIAAVEPKVLAPQGIPEGLSASPAAIYCTGTQQVSKAVPGSATPEVYYPEAMNLKLAQHSELRVRTRLDAVGTCAEAGAFMTSYSELLNEQPELFAAGSPDTATLGHRPESEDIRLPLPSETPSSHGNIGTSQEAVLNGTATIQNGAVRISDAAGNWCSGISISKFHALTSAHCFPGTSGWFRGAISRSVCTGGACFLLPAPYSEMWLYLTRHPGYTGNGDYADDVSVVTIYPVYDDGTVTFPDPAAGNALRLWLGSLTANSTVATMYGFGPNATNGTGSGVLRVGTNTLSSVSTGFFWAYRTGNQALCQGDSGGPAVVGSDKVAGIASTVSAAACPSVGGWSLWTRLGNQLSWIESVMAYPFGTGYRCNRFGSGLTAYARCW